MRFQEPTGAEIRTKSEIYAAQLGGMACTQAASDSPKSREIPEKLSRLFDRTELLSMHIAKLTGRLEPLLTLRAADAEEKKSAMYGCQLGGQLAELAARIELLIEAIDTLESQLQL